MDIKYPINLKMFFSCFTTLSAWMAVWIIVPFDELVWGPIKYVIISIFAPIGIILLGTLTGYSILAEGSRLKIGFLPFRKLIHFDDITFLSRTASCYLRFWHTSEYITVKMRNGRSITIPCNDADKIIETIRRLKGDE